MRKWTEDIVRNFPWLVIDPSSLIHDPTPRDFDELADRTNPLWRQFYLDWLCHKHPAISRDYLARNLTYLSEIHRTSAVQRLRARHDDAVRLFTRLGNGKPGEEFYRTVARPLKDAIENAARRERRPVAELGRELATDVLLNGRASLPPDQDFIAAAANLSSSREKGQLAESYEKLVACATDVVSKARLDPAAVNAAVTRLERGWLNRQEHETALREKLAPVQDVLLYLRTPEKRADMVRSARALEEHERIEAYRRADEGVQVRELWAAVAAYGQALVALGIDFANVSQVLVDQARGQAGKQMKENFAAVFKEVGLGLQIAKTAVTAAGVICGFFPPIGTAVGGGLAVSMMVIDKAVRAYYVHQATHDPSAVIEQFGKTFEKVPKSDHGELAETIVENGILPADLAQAGAELASNEDLHVVISGLAEASTGLRAVNNVVQGAGIVLALGELAWDWYQWDEVRKRKLTEHSQLTDQDVADLREGLTEHWMKQRSNTYWNPRTGTFLGMRERNYRVMLDGVVGEIDRDTFAFSPDDRSTIHDKILGSVRDKAELAFHGVTLYPKWDQVKAVRELDKDGNLVVELVAGHPSGVLVGCTASVSWKEAAITHAELPPEPAAARSRPGPEHTNKIRAKLARSN